MRLQVINAGSKGNAFILEADNTALLIECGVPFNDIKKAVDFNLNKIDCCILTHEHKDHSKSINNVLQSGIPVYASRGTFEALKTPEELQCILNHAEPRQFRQWRFVGLNSKHDAKDPMFFNILHPSIGSVLFITDCYLQPYKLQWAFDHVIIEANYQQSTIDAIAESKGEAFVNKRRVKSHMSFEVAMLTLSKLDLSKCKNIILTHLSEGFTNANEMKAICESQFGIPTTIAKPGIIINFDSL